MSRESGTGEAWLAREQDLDQASAHVRAQVRAHRRAPVRVLACTPGTWGELVQGTVDGTDVLVTCPVNLHVLALARSEAPGVPCYSRPPLRPATVATGELWRGPSARSRVCQALAELPGSGRVRLRSPLRPGAGMGSSTADLCAALAAAAAALDVMLTPAELFARCLRLEPSDGLMFPGIALVDHRRGTRVERWGPPPPLVILGIDPGGQVDTAAFNARPDLTAANRRKAAVVRAAVDLARQAVAAGDAAALAAAATASAAAHQAILPNPLWARASALARECGALGVNVAHSGTVLGVLLDPHRHDALAIRSWLQPRLGLPVRVLRLVGGGVTVAPPAAQLTPGR